MNKKIFLVLLMVFVGFGLVACDESTTTTSSSSTYAYSDFPNLLIYDSDMQLNMSDGTYYIYFYGSSCSHCITIKQDVLTIIASLEDDTVYLVDTDFYYINSSINVTGTPSLVKVVDHRVNRIYSGTTDVLSALEGLS